MNRTQSISKELILKEFLRIGFEKEIAIEIINKLDSDSELNSKDIKYLEKNINQKIDSNYKELNNKIDNKFEILNTKFNVFIGLFIAMVIPLTFKIFFNWDCKIIGFYSNSYFLNKLCKYRGECVVC